MKNNLGMVLNKDYIYTTNLKFLLMETIDKRGQIFEINEIYKFKSLLNIADRDVIKKIVYDGDEQCQELYNEFMMLVVMEEGHEINKVKFYALRDDLIGRMKNYLESK